NSEPQDPRRIHLSAADVRATIARESRRAGRPLELQEARARVQRQVDEEVLVRHGLALGLDEGDLIVRRRIVQQLQLLADIEIQQPTDDQLRTFLDTHADLYRRDERWNLEQRAYGPGHPGQEAATQALNSGNLHEGVRALAFGHQLGWRSAPELERLLGDAVVARLRREGCRSWCGPVESTHGFMLLRVSDHRPATVPTLAELRPRLRQRWLSEARQAARATRLEELRDQYAITIDWPSELDDTRLAEATP
ncbi:MAG: peptidylprolyl isomerase, partial [Myxococcota bacterium]